MTIKIRDIATKWVSDDERITLYMHPETPFKYTLAWNTLDQLLPAQEGNSVISNIRTYFSLIEGFVLDFDCEHPDLAICKYLANRTEFNFQENYNLFINLLGNKDLGFLIQAFNDTRAQTPIVDKDDTAKKK